MIVRVPSLVKYHKMEFVSAHCVDKGTAPDFKLIVTEEHQWVSEFILQILVKWQFILNIFFCNKVK